MRYAVIWQVKGCLGGYAKFGDEASAVRFAKERTGCGEAMPLLFSRVKDTVTGEFVYQA